MVAIHLSDDLHRVIERHVAEGRAASASALLEEAVLRLVEAARLEDDDLARVAAAGADDIAAGRFVTVATAEDRRRVEEDTLARLRGRAAAGKGGKD